MKPYLLADGTPDGIVGAIAAWFCAGVWAALASLGVLAGMVVPVRAAARHSPHVPSDRT